MKWIQNTQPGTNLEKIVSEIDPTGNWTRTLESSAHNMNRSVLQLGQWYDGSYNGYLILFTQPLPNIHVLIIRRIKILMLPKSLLISS